MDEYKVTYYLDGGRHKVEEMLSEPMVSSLTEAQSIIEMRLTGRDSFCIQPDANSITTVISGHVTYFTVTRMTARSKFVGNYLVAIEREKHPPQGGRGERG